jgi:sorting nexin-25
LFRGGTLSCTQELEDDFGDEAAPTSLAWKPADRNDLALISETYLSNSKIADWVVKTTIRAFRYCSGVARFPALRNVLTAPDLYWKYLASDEASAAQAPVRQPSPIAVTFEAPERHIARRDSGPSKVFGWSQSRLGARS